MALDHLTVEHLSLKDLTRIFSKIEIHPDLQHSGTPCWIWCASRLRNQGYGYVTWKHWPYRAHRFMYTWLVHALPKNSHEQELDHLCRRPACVNPCHLEVVTALVNHRRGNTPDAVNSRKTHCSKGHDFAEHGITIRGNRRVCTICQYSKMRQYLLTAKGRAFKDRCNEKRKNESPERRAQRNQQRRARYARRKAVSC